MARTRKKWPADLDPLIIAEANNGTGPTQIMRLIRSGELEGMEKPYAVPNGTFYDHWEKLKPLLDPAAEIPKGEELETAGNIERLTLAVARREVKRIEAAQAKGRLSTGDIAKLRQCAKTAGEIRRSLSPTNGKGRQAAAAEAARDAHPSPLAQRAARFIEQEAGRTIDRNDGDAAPDPTKSEQLNGDGEARSKGVNENGKVAGPSHTSARELYPMPG